MQGKTVDMDLLQKTNLSVVGNAPVNARGDELGPEIVKTREDVLADYYRDNPANVESNLYVKKQMNCSMVQENKTATKSKYKKKLMQFKTSG